MNTLRSLPGAGPAVVLSLALIALAGCAGTPERYYTLARPADARPAVAAPATQRLVEVLPVTVPERLARPQMLVRKDARGAEVELLEQHRWSSSFEVELRDALAAGISERLGAVDVSKGPRPGAQPSWRVTVQVRRLDLVEGGKVDAVFGWNLRKSDETRSLACLWDGVLTVGPGIEALAEGAQRVTAALSRDIARAIDAASAAAAPQPCPERLTGAD